MTSFKCLSVAFSFLVLGLIIQPQAFADSEPELKGVTKGPAHVVMGDNLASIDIPAGYMFAGKEIAKKLLEQGGSSGEGALGLVLPIPEKGKNEKENDEDSFYIISRFEESGYVHDKDADKLNADDILKSYKEGTVEQNKERKDLGLDPIYVGGWAEKPKYEKAKHQVVWAIEVKDQDTSTAPVEAINYNTRILGRRGVLSMNLVTSLSKFPENKAKIQSLLDKTEFTKGNTYGEYQEGKDKASGYGLTGLILGGGAMAAAAKMGLLGGLWKWLLALIIAGKKFIVLIVIGIAGLFAKIFGKKDGGGPR